MGSLPFWRLKRCFIVRYVKIIVYICSKESLSDNQLQILIIKWVEFLLLVLAVLVP